MSEVPVERRISPEWYPALIDLATQVWRLERILAGLESGSDPPERALARIGRQVEALKDTLGMLGCSFQHHDGERFDPGLALRVVAVQEEAGLAGPVVVETVKPSVYIGDRLVSPGQVIVARPAAPAGEQPEKS